MLESSAHLYIFHRHEVEERSAVAESLVATRHGQHGIGEFI